MRAKQGEYLPAHKFKLGAPVLVEGLPALVVRHESDGYVVCLTGALILLYVQEHNIESTTL